MNHAARQLGGIALLALLVRVLVPAGYMVAAAETPEGHRLVITMCEGHSGTTQINEHNTHDGVDPDSPPLAPAKNDPTKQPCAFAAAPHFATPVAVAEPLAFETQTVVASDVAVDSRTGLGIASPPPPSTGPPKAVELS